MEKFSWSIQIRNPETTIPLDISDERSEKNGWIITEMSNGENDPRNKGNCPNGIVHLQQGKFS